eukprot:6568119-Prymnesium_polylepis.1
MRGSWRVPSGGMIQGDGGVRAGVRETANPACGARGGRPLFSLLLRYRRVAWKKSAPSPLAHDAMVPEVCSIDPVWFPGP